MKLLIATTNPNKIREIRPLLAGLPLALVTLADMAAMPEPEETGATFWENARIKALAYAQATGLLTVAEDSGLAVDALGGEPGIHSARFPGASTPYPERFTAIFRRIGEESRTARFVTALALARGHALLFETEASVDGEIAHAPAGDHGFGYDPIFYYPPFGQTTAQLIDSEKASISHRARAFRDLKVFLQKEPASFLRGA